MIMFFLVPVWIVGILGSFCLLFFRPLRPFAFPIGFSVVLTLPFAFAALIGTLYAAQNLFHLHISSGYGPAAAELIVLLLVSGIGGCVGLLAGFGIGLAINRPFKWKFDFEKFLDWVPVGRPTGWSPRQ
jgi:hypothetical protein